MEPDDTLPPTARDDAQDALDAALEERRTVATELELWTAKFRAAQSAHDERAMALADARMRRLEQCWLLADNLVRQLRGRVNRAHWHDEHDLEAPVG